MCGKFQNLHYQIHSSTVAANVAKMLDFQLVMIHNVGQYTIIVLFLKPPDNVHYMINHNLQTNIQLNYLFEPVYI